MNANQMRAPASALTPVDFDPFAAASGAVVLPLTDPQQEVWAACQMAPQAATAYNQCFALRLEGPLFYANARPVRDGIKQLVGARQPPPAAVIIESGAIARLDITSAEMLKGLVTTLRSAGVTLALADVRGPVIETARRSGLSDVLNEEVIFDTIKEAIAALDHAGTAAAHPE